jgi:hypothetical protein
MGNKTRQALAQAEKDGWQVINHRLVRRPEPEKTVSFNPSTSPSVIGLPLNYGFPSSKKETLDNGIAHLTNKNLSEKEI